MTPSLIEDVARCPRLDLAVSALLIALRMKATGDILTSLPDAAVWRAMTYQQRLAQLAGWFVAQCHEAIERSEQPIPTTVRHLRVVNSNGELR